MGPMHDREILAEALPEYLSLILAAGNYLNGGPGCWFGQAQRTTKWTILSGTPRGQADGFDLSELDKLTGGLLT